MVKLIGFTSSCLNGPCCCRDGSDTCSNLTVLYIDCYGYSFIPIFAEGLVISRTDSPAVPTTPWLLLCDCAFALPGTAMVNKSMHANTVDTNVKMKKKGENWMIAHNKIIVIPLLKRYFT